MIATTLLCLVFSVSDGDTLTARCDAAAPQTLRVRLDGIDAPERGQPWGNRARHALRTLVLHKRVQLRCHKIDRYQRHVCAVWAAAPGTTPTTAPDSNPYTLDVGLALLTQGLAWWYRHYAHEQTPQQRGRYEFAEQQARSKRVGLWASRSPPVPPWQWRARNRQ